MVFVCALRIFEHKISILQSGNVKCTQTERLSILFNIAPPIKKKKLSYITNMLDKLNSLPDLLLQQMDILELRLEYV